MLEGLGQADSLSLDPHKWLFQPYEAATVLVRNARWLRETFHILPEYLEDTQGLEGEVNYSDRGIQMTRGFRALKLWMSLKVFGEAAFGEALDRGFVSAEVAEAAVKTLPGWEVVTPAQMGIVTFRCVPEGMTIDEVNHLNRRLVGEMIADGYAMMSSTTLRGRTVLRMCTINPRTTEADVQETIRRLDDMARGLVPGTSTKNG